MKILYCENVGCLQKIDNPIDLGKKCFLYGLNGAGKSTIKKIFSSAFKESGQLNCTFGIPKNNCNAKITIMNKIVEYKKSKIIKPLTSINLHVYDDEYVENCIYVNGNISDTNKKEYYRIFVGDDVNQKINNILQLNSQLIDNQNKLSELIKKIQNEVNNMLKLIELFPKINKILLKKYNVEYDVDDLIKIKLETLLNGLSQKKVSWLKLGKKYLGDGANCPFCSLPIKEDIMENLINHYNEITFDQNEIINNCKLEINAYITQLNMLESESDLLFNDKMLINRFLVYLKNLLYEKNEDLDNSINIDPYYIKVINQISRKVNFLTKLVYKLNNTKENLDINDIFSINVSSLGLIDINKLKSRINRLTINKEFSNLINIQLESNYKLNRKIISKMDKINNEQNNKIQNNIDYINTKLDMYGFKYQLKKGTTTKQKNLKNSSDALLQLYLVPNNISNIEKEFTKDTIKTILSEGEKTILSWVFFLLDLRSKLTKGRHLIIIDDPISSYDSYRRFNLINELNYISKLPVELEFLILSHEKSFSNLMSSLNKCKYFNVIDGKINNITNSDINESNFKNDILYIKENNIINNDKELLKFLIIARNVMEYYKSLSDYVNAKYFRKNLYHRYYNELSSLIHLQSNSLSISFFDYLTKILKKLINQKIRIEVNSIIDLNNINFSNLLINPIDDIYLARVKINKYLIEELIRNNISFDVKSTTGNLLDLAKSYIHKDIYEKINLYLPIVNVYNHPNDNFGLRTVDCSELRKQDLYQFVSNL